MIYMKRLLFALLLIALILVIYLRPKTFEKYIIGNRISVTYLDISIEDGIPNSQSYEFYFSITDTEFNDLVRILGQYSYHNTINFNNLIKGNTKTLMIALEDNMIIITDTSRIIINDTVYRIGFWSDKKSKSLFNDLLLILNIHH